MSMAATFDTLKFVETLKASGFDETQAKGLAVAIRDVQATQLEDVADKRDLKELEGQLSTKADVTRVEMHILELKRDIKELELSTKAEIARLQADIAPMKWMMAVIVAGIVALVLKAFFPVVWLPVTR